MGKGVSGEYVVLVLSFVWPPLCVLGAVLVCRRAVGTCRRLADSAAKSADAAHQDWHDMCARGTEPTVRLPRVTIDTGSPVTKEDQLATPYHEGRGRAPRRTAGIGRDRSQRVPQQRFTGELPAPGQRKGD